MAGLQTVFLFKTTVVGLSIATQQYYFWYRFLLFGAMQYFPPRGPTHNFDPLQGHDDVAWLVDLPLPGFGFAASADTDI